MHRLLKDIHKHRYALSNQFIVNLKTTVATTRLGPLWWILDPIVLMSIYYFVVVVVFNRGGPNFHIFALCGIVSWQSFSRSINICMRALRGNASLIKQTALPLQLYILIPPIVQSFFYFLGLCIIGIWNNSVVGWHTLTAPLLLLPMALIPFGLGLFLSILEVHLPDTGKFLPYILRIGFYLSPVLYPVERIYNSDNIPNFIKTIYSFNPTVHIIGSVRDVLFTGEFFDIKGYILLLSATLIVVQLGLIFFNRFSAEVPKAL